MSDTLMEASAPFGAAPDSLFLEVLQRFRSTNPTFLIGDDVVRRYHLAMQTRGFVILSGSSGTGKTWLAQAYADAIGARPKLAAVDPSWSSNEDLLGYLSPLDGFYHHTPFSEFVQEAAREWTAADMAGRSAREFHVILDEMNLARVEHYFSRFLSAMEVRSREGIARLDLAPGHTVELTPNLKFAGTVNMDETTHGFADKVYDRAQLIELPLQRSYVVEYLEGEPYSELVLKIWDALRPIAPFGFRVLEEIQGYLVGRDRPGHRVAHRAGRAVGPEGAAAGARRRRPAGRGPGGVPVARWAMRDIPWRAARPSSCARTTPPMGSPATSEDVAPSAVSLEVLRDIVRGRDGRPGLVDVLPRLQREHRKDLIREERWTSGDLARHPEPRELVRSRRKPGNLDEHGKLKRIYDSRRILTSDIHENRVVKHAVGEVRAALDASEEDEALLMLLELDAATAQATYLHDVGRPQGTSGCSDGDPGRPSAVPNGVPSLARSPQRVSREPAVRVPSTRRAAVTGLRDPSFA